MLDIKEASVRKAMHRGCIEYEHTWISGAPGRMCMLHKESVEAYRDSRRRGPRGKLGPQYHLTLAERRRLVKAHQRGQSGSAIARAMGCSSATTYRWINRAANGEGLQTRERPDVPACKLRPDVQERICALWQAGMHNYSKIARKVTPLQHPEFGQGVGSQAVDRATVKKVLQLRGIVE